jgi:hypothetical protein
VSLVVPACRFKQKAGGGEGCLEIKWGDADVLLKLIELIAKKEGD